MWKYSINKYEIVNGKKIPIPDLIPFVVKEGDAHTGNTGKTH